MERPVLEREAGESDLAYLDRLNGMETAGWSVDDQMARVLLIRDTQRALAAHVGNGADAPQRAARLCEIKRLIRGLSERDRHALARWIALGMPE